MAPVLIGIAGGTASGKYALCQNIVDRLEHRPASESHPRVVVIRLDSFYKSLTPEKLEQVKAGVYNFDHPDTFDWVRLRKTLEDLLKRKNAVIPQYDFETAQMKNGAEIEIKSPDIILLEGILALYDPAIRNMMSMKIFVDEASDVRLSRRVVRDHEVYKRPVDQILKYYVNLVKPTFEDFIFPTKRYADIVIPRGTENPVALDLIVMHLDSILSEKKQLTPKKATPVKDLEAQPEFRQMEE